MKHVSGLKPPNRETVNTVLVFGSDMIDNRRLTHTSEEYRECVTTPCCETWLEKGYENSLSLCDLGVSVSGSAKSEELPPIAVKRLEKAVKPDTKFCVTLCQACVSVSGSRAAPKTAGATRPAPPPPKPPNVKRTRTGYP